MVTPEELKEVTLPDSDIKIIDDILREKFRDGGVVHINVDSVNLISTPYNIMYNYRQHGWDVQFKYFSGNNSNCLIFKEKE